MNTRLYIDGYNLYFGCLKGTPYKWLDPVSLSKKLLMRSGAKNSTLDSLAVKFFTAEISPRAASDSSSLKDQRSYHQALHLKCGTELQTIKGSYSIDKTKFPQVEKDASGKEKEPKNSSRVKIWKMEEKQSDVNIAVEAVYDALVDPSIEQVVFMTNDTDIVPALKKIEEFNKLNKRTPVKIGLIAPIKPNDEYRNANGSLSKFADWTIHYIAEEELASAQLPCRIPGKNSAFKPISWFKYPEKVQEILSILSHKDVEKSVPKAWKWLDKPLHQEDSLPSFDGKPSEHMDNEDALNSIIIHAKAYADYKKSAKG